MTYNDLKKQIERFHIGEISKKELAMAIAMWQRGIPESFMNSLPSSFYIYWYITESFFNQRLKHNIILDAYSYTRASGEIISRRNL